MVATNRGITAQKMADELLYWSEKLPEIRKRGRKTNT